MLGFFPVARVAKEGSGHHADCLLRRQPGQRLAGQLGVFYHRAGTVPQFDSEDGPLF
jgi:hypothetical protein